MAPQESRHAGAGPTAEELAQLRENTLRLMRHGWRVPVLPRHAAAGSIDGGPQLAPVRAVGHPAGGNVKALSQSIGHLVDLVQLTDGSLAQVIELADEFADAQFTSPEIRPQWTDPAGQKYGPIIAHVALTAHPQSRGQTRLMPIEGNDTPQFPPAKEGGASMSSITEHAIRDHGDVPPEDIEIVEPVPPTPLGQLAAHTLGPRRSIDQEER